MKKSTRFIALLLAALFCVALIPMSAFAKTGTIHPYGEGTITIQSEYDSAFDYLEYYHNGEWKDLNTPRHWIVETGEDVYCIEHASNSPHGGSYEETSPSALFGTATLEGLESIFEYGYPCVLPDGFTPDEARQATANAIRFWSFWGCMLSAYFSITEAVVIPATARSTAPLNGVLRRNSTSS